MLLLLILLLLVLLLLILLLLVLLVLLILLVLLLLIILYHITITNIGYWIDMHKCFKTVRDGLKQDWTCETELTYGGGKEETAFTSEFTFNKNTVFLHVKMSSHLSSHEFTFNEHIVFYR